jgi:hypothetical protein
MPVAAVLKDMRRIVSSDDVIKHVTQLPGTARKVLLFHNIEN